MREQAGVDLGERAAHRAGGARHRGRVVESEERREHLHEGLQRFGAEVVFAVAAEYLARVPGGTPQEFLDEPRLAQPRGRRNRDQVRLAGQRFSQARVEHGELRLAAHVARQAAPRQRLEARAHVGAPANRERGDRRIAPFEREQAALAGLKKVAFRAERFLAHQNFVAQRHTREPGGDVGRGAHQLEAAAHQVTLVDQHQPGVDAGVQRERAAVRQGRVEHERAHRVVQGERRVGGTPAVVFLRVGVAEDRQHTVALNAHDGAAVFRDQRAAGVAQLAEHHAVVLGLDLLGQLGGVAQVGKQDREVTPSRRAGCGRGRRRGRRRERVEGVVRGGHGATVRELKARCNHTTRTHGVVGPAGIYSDAPALGTPT